MINLHCGPFATGAFVPVVLFEQGAEKTFIAPKVVTIEEFMSTISGLKSIDNTQLLLEMFVLNKKINPSGDNDMVKFSGWAQQFLGDINDIDLHLVDAKSLFTTVADIKELALFNTPLEERSARQLAWLEFFKRLWIFYSEFNVSLLNRHAGYQGMIYRYVAEHIHELIPNIGYSKVVFCGFNALTVAEKKVIEVLLKEQIAELTGMPMNIISTIPCGMPVSFYGRILRNSTLKNRTSWCGILPKSPRRFMWLPLNIIWRKLNL